MIYRQTLGASLRITLSAIILVLAAFLAATLVIAPAGAHELRPAIAAATIERSGAVELRVAMNLESYIAGIGPQHSNSADAPEAAEYDRLRGLAPEALEVAFAPLAAEFATSFGLAFDGTASPLSLAAISVPDVGDTGLARVSTITLTGTAPAGAATTNFVAPERVGDTVFRVQRAGDETPFFSAFQTAGEATQPIPLQGAVADGGWWTGFADYIAIGFEHIVPKGLDHILFVVGLFLLSPHLRPLMWQVTGFTLAHSVTLALGIYGVVRISPAIVEPLIAASIVFVAVENLFTDRLQRWRPFVVFGFGLLHGLGFAGVLAEVGLPASQFVPALIGFNLGVELGQLAVVAACFLAVGLWFRHRDWYRRVITMPASAMVALVAAFWFFERIA
ncbi:MAG TPA: HupE/UreJ family protein [Thermohalobaculum sp.]|nr:HupE/UreJ family protein [Thermohalobaculum sp.]